ncbi:MAG: hypothetical protein U0103_04200 [Candidatus Obscuribacterales bacterium]
MAEYLRLNFGWKSACEIRDSDLRQEKKTLSAFNLSPYRVIKWAQVATFESMSQTASENLLFVAQVIDEQTNGASPGR